MNTVFKALNDPTRRKILELLKAKELNAGQIADNFSMSKPSISHHLDLLKRANLVTTFKEGQFIIYSINTTVLDDLFTWIYNLKNQKNESKHPSRNSSLDIINPSDSLPDS